MATDPRLRGDERNLFPALPTQVGTHGGWLMCSTAMDPDLRQERGGGCILAYPSPAILRAGGISGNLGRDEPHQFPDQARDDRFRPNHLTPAQFQKQLKRNSVSRDAQQKHSDLNALIDGAVAVRNLRWNEP
ncbi:MAG: hypothetical protein AAFV59_05760 [Pseudomonadota bacterium]